jgi:CRP-like cAMP-binding protein
MELSNFRGSRTLETLLASVSTFAPLRPDELARVAARFELVELAASETRRFAATDDDMRLVLVVHGTAKLELDDAGGAIANILGTGDRWGELELVAGRPRVVAIVAERPTVLALLDRAGFDAVLREFPVIALPLAAEIASELRATIDASRELAELLAEGLPAEQLAALIAARRRSHLRRRAKVRRGGIRGLFARLVIQQGQEPPFWMLAGFLVSLLLARAVVALILHFGLQKQLFALVPGNDPNPMHVHHFNYGLILVGLSGITALFPFGRRMLRVLAFVFGFGCGLVLDEFALFWNLNPSYKGAHLTAAAFAAALLCQLVYFRRLWVAIARRAWHRVRSHR